MATLLLWEPMFHPYVRIPGTIVRVSLDCVPKQIDLALRTSNAQVADAHVLLVHTAGENSDARVNVRPTEERLERSLIIHLPTDEDQRAVASKMLASNERRKIELFVNFHQLPFVDIQRVGIVSAGPAEGPCRDKLLEGSNLQEKLLVGNARLMRYDLLQEILSNLILATNEVVGNILLACMVLSVVWLSFVLWRGVQALYATSDARLKEMVRRRMREVDNELASQGTTAVIAADYGLLHRRLAFARVTGPALGFALTVSSLVAALHPSVQAGQDAFRFVSSLQIAMVATLVGLIIRILAEFAIRFHRSSAEHAIALLKSTPIVENDLATASTTTDGGT